CRRCERAGANESRVACCAQRISENRKTAHRRGDRRVAMNDRKSEGRRQTSEVRSKRLEDRSRRSELNPVKGRGPNGALRPQPSIELRIEELVLRGFASADRHTIGHTAELELARLFV